MMKDRQDYRFQITFDALKQTPTALRNHATRAFYRRVRSMTSVRSLRLVALQMGIYCLILVGAVGVTLNGSKMLVDIIAAKMFQMGYEVALQNLPRHIETASFRPSVE